MSTLEDAEENDHFAVAEYVDTLQYFTSLPVTVAALWKLNGWCAYIWQGIKRNSEIGVSIPSHVKHMTINFKYYSLS